MFVLLSPLLGENIKNFNKIKMVGIGGGLFGCGMGMLFFQGPFVVAVAACAIDTVGEIIFFSMTQLVCYEQSLQAQRGKNLGLYRMVYASSRVVGPALGGIVYHQFGGRAIWVFSGAVGLFCLATSRYFQTKK
jgi:MFS family permease